jgi:hypothetical protein
MIKSGACAARFTKLVPKALDRFPFIIWITFGTHNHPPPAMKKTPKAVYNELFDLIKKINDPGLTRSQ